MGILVRLAINGAAIWSAIQVVDGLDFTGDWPALAFITIAMAVVNAAIKPLATLFSIPFIILTLGLFILVVNALMLSVVLWLSEVFGLGLTSTGWGPTFIASIVISLVSWVLTALFGLDD